MRWTQCRRAEECDLDVDHATSPSGEQQVWPRCTFQKDSFMNLRNRARMIQFNSVRFIIIIIFL